MSGPPPLSATWQQADDLRAQGDFAGARDLLEPAADVAAIRLGPDLVPAGLSISERIQKGIALLPGDRLGESALSGM